MTQLEVWEKRRPEEANLFNPAFLGSLIFEVVKEAGKSRANGVAMTFLPVILALALHRSTRERLPASTVSSLYEWVQNNEDVLIGLAERIIGLKPYVQEALRFSLHSETLEIGEGHHIIAGKKKAHFPGPYLKTTTSEVKDIVKQSQFLCRWFLKSGTEPSVLSCWGVRP